MVIVLFSSRHCITFAQKLFYFVYVHNTYHRDRSRMINPELRLKFLSLHPLVQDFILCGNEVFLPTMPASYRQIHKEFLKQSHRHGHSSNQKLGKAGGFAQSTCCCMAPWTFHSVHAEPRTCRMELSCQTK